MDSVVTVNWSAISFIAVAIMQLFAIAGCYYGLKADNAKLASDVAIAMLKERTDRTADQSSLRNDVNGLLAAADLYVKDLAHRVSTLEAGQDEWTKALRARTHELANQLQGVAIRLDRLERPGHPVSPVQS